MHIIWYTVDTHIICIYYLYLSIILYTQDGKGGCAEMVVMIITSFPKLNTSTVISIHLPCPWEHHVTHSSVASSGVLLHRNPERSSSCPLQPAVHSVLWLRRWTLSPPKQYESLIIMRLSRILAKWAYVTIMNTTTGLVQTVQDPKAITVVTVGGPFVETTRASLCLVFVAPGAVEKVPSDSSWWRHLVTW